MIHSQKKFAAMLSSLRQDQTESRTIEGKQDLHLDTEGDRAYFIRHIAALANNVEPSYLIVGVEDRTWNPIGLGENSGLLNVDQTQRRMNQTLKNKLDPNLAVRYRTHQVDGFMYGLVEIEGVRAPYLVAIEDQSYGGQRTQARPDSIYRGAIYVRHGANSVIANRQSDLFQILNRSQVSPRNEDREDDFLADHNYIGVDAEDFGHHSLTDDLIQFHIPADEPGGGTFPAESWVSFVFCPHDPDLDIDTIELQSSLRPDQGTGRKAEWYHRLPDPFVKMLYSPEATPREFLGRYSSTRETDGITHFIRIRPSGHIEIACTDPLFIVRKGRKCFLFVCLIGYLWQSMYLAQTIYQNSGYYGPVTVLANLIGTEGAIIAEYAQSQPGSSTTWTSPFNIRYRGEPSTCQYTNLQIRRELDLADSSDDEIEATVREIARDIGSYFGQGDEPRCFIYNTGEFPVNQYSFQCRA